MERIIQQWSQQYNIDRDNGIITVFCDCEGWEHIKNYVNAINQNAIEIECFIVEIFFDETVQMDFYSTNFRYY